MLDTFLYPVSFRTSVSLLCLLLSEASLFLLQRIFGEYADTSITLPSWIFIILWLLVTLNIWWWWGWWKKSFGFPMNKKCDYFTSYFWLIHHQSIVFDLFLIYNFYNLFCFLDLANDAIKIFATLDEEIHLMIL